MTDFTDEDYDKLDALAHKATEDFLAKLEELKAAYPEFGMGFGVDYPQRSSWHISDLDKRHTLVFISLDKNNKHQIKSYSSKDRKRHFLPSLQIMKENRIP